MQAPRRCRTLGPIFSFLETQTEERGLSPQFLPHTAAHTDMCTCSLRHCEAHTVKKNLEQKSENNHSTALYGTLKMIAAK